MRRSETRPNPHRGGIVLLLFGLVWSPTPVHAQVLVYVTDAIFGNPVPFAAVQLTTSTNRVLETQSTNLHGRASLLDLNGGLSVRVTALGYSEVTVEIDSRTELEISLEPAPLRVDSLAVTVDGTGPLPGRLQFTQRREEHGGIFLDPFDVGIKSKYGVIEVFRELEGIRRIQWGGSRIMPTIVSNLGRGCFNYRLNNLRVQDGRWNVWPLSSLMPQDVMAVEIYRYIGEVPRELIRDASPASGETCGLIVIWTTEAW